MGDEKKEIELLVTSRNDQDMRSLMEKMTWNHFPFQFLGRKHFEFSSLGSTFPAWQLAITMKFIPFEDAFLMSLLSTFLPENLMAMTISSPEDIAGKTLKGHFLKPLRQCLHEFVPRAA
jgi:hypothetical protein